MKEICLHLDNLDITICILTNNFYHCGILLNYYCKSHQ